MRARQAGLLIVLCALLLGVYLGLSSDHFSGELNLIPLNKTEEVLLVDHRRRVVHKWQVDSPRTYLMPNGDLIALHGTHSHRDKKKFKKSVNKISRYDWAGKEVWSYVHPEKLHHDFAVAQNGIYLLSHKYIENFFQDRHVKRVPSTYRLRLDQVVKINLDGEKIWEWSPDPDRFDQVGCKNRPCQNNVKSKYRTLDWTHFNSIKLVPPNQYFEEGLEFRPGNLIIMARNWHQIIIVDTQSKSIVWEYPAKGEAPINGGHEASMIPAGHPGAGNIILFENGWEKPGKGQSALIELNPVTRKIEWTYKKSGFYSEYQGSVQRLLNGNTFVSSDYQRTCFELGADNQIVWSLELNQHIYRCRRYEPGYLSGRM